MVQTPSKAIATSNSTEIDKTFKLLEEGEKNIVLREEYKDITLILGNTGSGKSTFIQWLAGDNSKLISKEVGEDTGEFIIEDGNRIGSSSVNSKTTFPELVVDSRTNTAYYDCPGFSDTRSTSHDISATYFVKKLTDHATNVKIILIVGYPSVRKGVDRLDFMKLLKHVTDLIKNMKNFENSIAIGITKVDNQYIKRGKTFSVVPDNTIIQSIGNFMQEIKEGVEDKLKISDTSNEDKIFYNKAIELLNILLKQNNKVFTRIGIFRRPDESGPLNNIVLLQEGKKHLQKIIYEEIKFTKKVNTDFGYTISEKSKNDINILVDKISEKVRNDISEIVDKVTKFYRNLKDEMQQRINSFLDNATNIDVRETEAKNFSTKLNVGYREISRLLKEIKNLISIEKLGNNLNITITNLGISTCTENIKNILIQGKVFSFLQTVSGEKINTRSWLDLFQKIDIFLINSKNDIEKSALHAAEKTNSGIINLSKNIAKEIKTHYLNQMELLEVEVLLTELNKGSGFMSNLIKQIKNVRSAQELSKKITDTMTNDLPSTSSAIRRDTLRILHYGKYLDFLKILNNEVVDTWTSESVKSFSDTARYLYESDIWYKFLYGLKERFSEYDIQQNKIKYNVVNLNDWGYQNRPKGIQIDKNNFRLFLDKLKNFDKIKYDDVKNIEITDLFLKELNNVLDVTIKRELEFHCPKPGELLIRGDFIKFSDFVDANGKVVDFCKKGIEITSVDIFSVNTIFIDSNFRGLGSQVSIAAPKWQIVGRRTINLNGASGAATSYYSYYGRHGHPGLPGAAGGNFLGIGKEFINIKQLTITANGGQGGKGQTGGDGRQGIDGESARISDDFHRQYIRDDKIIAIFYNKVTDTVRFYGKSGTVGGNGGNGGAGGLGGKNGQIKIFKLNKSSDLPSTESILGPVGIAGSGGIGGRGGKYGDDLKAFYCKKYVTFIRVSTDWCSHPQPITELNYKRAQSGLNGISGHNTQGRQQPESPKEFKNILNFVNNYKNYLLVHLANRYKKNSLIQFISEIDSDSDLYDTKRGTTSTKHLSNRPDRHQRKRRELSDLPFTATRSSTWMTRLRKSVGILPIYSKGLLPQSFTSVSLSSPEFTAGHIHGGLQLLDLIVRKCTGQKYPKLISICDQDYAEMCVHAAEIVENFKETHVTSDDFERYQALLTKKPPPGYTFN